MTTFIPICKCTKMCTWRIALVLLFSIILLEQLRAQSVTPNAPTGCTPENTFIVMNLAGAGANGTSIKIIPLASPTTMYTKTCFLGSSTPVIDAGEGVAFDPSRNRLYVARYNERTITILNATTGEIVRTISTAPFAPLDVDVSVDGSRIYVNLYNHITAYDVTTGAKVASTEPAPGLSGSIPGGGWGLSVNPVTGNVYVSQPWTSTEPAAIFIHNPTTLALVGTITPP